MRFFKPILSQKTLYAVLTGLTSTLIFCSPLFALDPKKRITQYDMRLYQAEHGLPMNDMKTVFQDSKGYIWLGCQEGLVRFDGVRFVLFDKSKYPGLRENFIWDIKEDWEGNLWLATNGGGVSCFDGKTFTTFDTSNGLPSNVVKCILITKDQKIWFGTEKGLSQYKDGTFTTLLLNGIVENQHIFCFLEDDSGHLIVGRRHYGLDVLIDGSFRNYPTDSSSYVRWVFKRKSGEILAGTVHDRIYVYRNGRINKFTLYQLPETQTIQSMLEDREGNVWFCTDGNGIVRYANGRFETLKAENGLPEGHNFFLHGIEDREGNLWFVGDGGLLQLKDNKFTAFGRNEGFSTNFGQTVCEDSDGNMWAGLRQGGLVKFDRFATQVWTKDYEVTAALPMNKGGIWLGNFGLNYLKGRKLFEPTIDKQYNEEQYGGFHVIKSLFENNRSELYFGTAYGYLTKLYGKRFDTYQIAKGESGSVICVVERSNGEVWAGTWKQGLYRLVKGNVYHFSEADDFIADGVNALYEDNERVLWIATDGHGLYRYKDGQFANINSKHRLAFDRLFSILEDDDHNLWFSGNRGIFRTSKRQLNIVADGKADSVHCESYNHLDGMRETECNGRRQPVAWKSRDSRLWFVSTAGVVCVDPNNMPVNKVPPPVYLEEVIVNKQRAITPDSSLFHCKASERELEFRFTALSFTIPERVKFSYKLEGYDQDWVEAGTRRSAFYTNLPKGDYTFRVKACNNDGIWNEAGATMQLRIAPFWWETWWAYGLYVLALLGIFLGIRRYEMKRVHLRNALKVQQVRTERLEELDHLKSRFFAGISHEFRTPLTLIGGPLEEILEETREAQKRSRLDLMLRNTRRLERLVDQLLDLAQLESGKMRLQARPVSAIPFLQDLVAAFESYALQKNIKLELRADDQLASESIFIDPDKMEKVIINLLSNALKYTPSGGNVSVAVGSERKTKGEERGVRGEARPSPIALRPTHSDDFIDSIEISVRDTGAGIPAQALPHIFDYFYRYRDENTRRESGTGIGLALTKELVELHHGEISVMSQEGKGSEFVIRLPFGKAHLKPEEIVASEQLSVVSNQFSVNSNQSFVANDDDASIQYSSDPTFQQSNDPAIQPSSDQSKRNGDPDSSGQPVVLLIEDNVDMRQYLREHLNHTNRLLEATNGEEGLQKAEEEIPDLIISEVMMPKMNGFELCRKLKTSELTSHIPVILLTARGSGESKMEGLELGADDYLTKPVSGRELQLRVKNWMERQRKLRERFRREIAAVDFKFSSLHLTSADEKFLQRAKEVLEKHLSDAEFGPEELAHEMAMSRAHLNRKLRGLLGQRTGEFIRTMRLKRGAELLRQKSGSVSEIAYQAGFNHLSYFARCFKKQYGQLPHEYGQS